MSKDRCEKLREEIEKILLKREMEFRAWHPEERKMYYDVYPADGEILIWCEGTARYCSLKFKKNPPILMQWTEFVDKNEKKIYDGDIVKTVCSEEEEIFVVVWDKYNGFVLKKPSYLLERLYIPVNFGDLETCKNEWDIEVLGNVFENPELLEM